MLCMRICEEGVIVLPLISFWPWCLSPAKEVFWLRISLCINFVNASHGSIVVLLLVTAQQTVFLTFTTAVRLSLVGLLRTYVFVMGLPDFGLVDRENGQMERYGRFRVASIPFHRIANPLLLHFALAPRVLSCLPIRSKTSTTREHSFFFRVFEWCVKRKIMSLLCIRPHKPCRLQGTAHFYITVHMRRHTDGNQA